MSRLLHHMQAFFARHEHVKNYWVAYSGGMDSQVLLSLCISLRQQFSFQLRAIHINHHLSPHAEQWSLFGKDYCDRHHIPFIEKHIYIEQRVSESLEEEARVKRYAQLNACLGEGDMLLTAHHQDDQAETVLIQMLRGAGPKGLSAMPVSKPFGAGTHARPLLTIPRAELLAYARTIQLSWVEDESNQDTRLTRNYVRHQLMPLLQARVPAAASTIARSASYCAESQVLLEEYALTLLAKIRGSQPRLLSVAGLLTLDEIKQRFLLRAWMAELGIPLPDAKKMDAICRSVLLAANDRMPCIKWGRNIELRRFRDDLYLLRSSAVTARNDTYVWNPRQTLDLPGIGLLAARRAKGQGLMLGDATISVRFRKEGEIVSIAGRGRLSLKNLFQEWQIPPWERYNVPLLFVGDRLVGVVGYFWDRLYTAKESEEGFVPEVLPR